MRVGPFFTKDIIILVFTLTVMEDDTRQVLRQRNKL